MSHSMRDQIIQVLLSTRSMSEGDTADALLTLLAAQPPAQAEPSTPAAKWRENGEPDPHGQHYDCERAKLAKGHLTDDELANALFLCDHRTSLESIGYLTAAKERIRWLSRKLCAQPESSPDTEQCLHSRLQSQHRVDNGEIPEWTCIDCGKFLGRSGDTEQQRRDATPIKTEPSLVCMCLGGFNELCPVHSSPYRARAAIEAEGK